MKMHDAYRLMAEYQRCVSYVSAAWRSSVDNSKKRRAATGREASTLVMDEIICTRLHDHATRSHARREPRRRFLLLSAGPRRGALTQLTQRWYSAINL